MVTPKQIVIIADERISMRLKFNIDLIFSRYICVYKSELKREKKKENL